MLGFDSFDTTTAGGDRWERRPVPLYNTHIKRHEVSDIHIDKLPVEVSTLPTLPGEVTYIYTVHPPMRTPTE
jgi:hypothetical protein